MTLLLLRVLATYVIARLLVEERGPLRVFERIRAAAGIVRSEAATEDQIDAYAAMTGFDPWTEDPPAWIATTEIGLALLCMTCTGAWAAMVALILAPSAWSVALVLEYAAVYGLYLILLRLLEVLDGVESTFKKD